MPPSARVISPTWYSPRPVPPRQEEPRRKRVVKRSGTRASGTPGLPYEEGDVPYAEGGVASIQQRSAAQHAWCRGVGSGRVACPVSATSNRRRAGRGQLTHRRTDPSRVFLNELLSRFIRIIVTCEEKGVTGKRRV